ncbi:hypothetical protein ABIF61_001114 [Bradyrhizobium japonicum]
MPAAARSAVAANPSYIFRDIFSNFFTSRSRFSRDSRWIQNMPSSWSISC